jgi:hypothetical protein
MSREAHLSYSEEDIQYLVVVVATFLLDRNILKCSVLVKECLSCMVKSLTEDEWANSRQKIAVDLTKYLTCKMLAKSCLFPFPV